VNEHFGYVVDLQSAEFAPDEVEVDSLLEKVV
jgi:hypothetical protein